MQKLLLSFSVVLCFSVVVGAVLFLHEGSQNQALAAPMTASCQTGFPRPLIFGVSGNGHQSAYGPLSEDEGGLVKAGSTLATVSLNWDHDTIQGKGPENYNPESVNFPIRKAVQTGLVVVVNISGTPNWASGNPGLPAEKAQPKRNDPTVLSEFKELVTQAVRDNKDKVKYWTYWNEPNGCMSSTGSCDYTDGSLKDFAYWHQVFYETVKAVDPNAQVIFGNLDFTSDNSDFIRGVHNLGNKIEYDYLGLNIYDKRENAKFAINWAKSGYDAQPSNYKKPVWINEWGFDTIWWCGKLSDNPSQAEKEKYNSCVASARQDIVPLIEDGLNKIRDNNWIYAAQYHHLRDVGGAYGLWDSGSPRPGGSKFIELVKNRCDPSFSTTNSGGTSSNPPPATNKDQITIRTYYEASSLGEDINPASWPSVSLFANNMAGLTVDGIPLDNIPCDDSVTDTRSKCGELNLFKNKLIANYQVFGSNFQTDHVVSTSKLFEFTAENLAFTKLSYAFYNDASSDNQDRNLAIKKIEFFGPDSKLFLSYEADGSEQGYKVTPAPANNRALENLYFDMGFINNTGEIVRSGSNAQDGMVGAFDKKELSKISAKSTKWALNQEGSFNLLSLAVYTEFIRNYPNTTTAACVVTTNDLGGTKLKNGQPVTLTSVASAPIKTFKYAFYVPGSGSTPTKAFCVAGAPSQPNDGCPSGSGQLVIESAGANQGAVQAMDWIRLPNGQVVQSIWKGNTGSNRQVPYNDSFGESVSVNWNLSSIVSSLAVGGPFKPMAEIDALTTYNTNNSTATMEIWRNNQMWYNIVPFTANGSNFDWGKAEGWKLYKDFNKESDAATWPGTGLVTARSSVVGKDNKLWHIYWRGDEEWARGVPIVNGNPNSALLDNQPNKGFVKTRTLSDLQTALKTTDRVQAISHIVMPDGNIQEQIWLGNNVWKRTMANSSSGPDFANKAYTKVVTPSVPQNEKVGSETIAYNKIHVQDTNLKAIPENLQVNATFVTDSGEQIGNNAACVTWFTFDKSVTGDMTGNCLVDIYDYNVLVQNYGKDNCAYNLAGTNGCIIDDKDIIEFTNHYGNTCQ